MHFYGINCWLPLLLKPISFILVCNLLTVSLSGPNKKNLSGTQCKNKTNKQQKILLNTATVCYLAVKPRWDQRACKSKLNASFRDWLHNHCWYVPNLKLKQRWFSVPIITPKGDLESKALDVYIHSNPPFIVTVWTLSRCLLCLSFVRTYLFYEEP